MSTPTLHVLVLGANGFLGRHICTELRRTGAQVREVAGTSTGADLTVAPQAQWDAWLDGLTGVVNAAGRTGGTLEELTRANVLLLAQAMQAASRHGLKFVHLSSAAEYGRTPLNRAVREDYPARPLSAYGASKLAGTQLLSQAVRAGQVDAVALRLTNPLGPHMSAGTLPGRAAQLLSQAAQDGQPSVQFGPLGAVRDFIDVRDAARAVRYALQQPINSEDGVLNVGSGEGRTVRDLVGGLMQLTGYAGALLEDAPGSPRSSDVPYQQADISRLQASGFKFKYTFADALRSLLPSPDPQHETPALAFSST